MYIAIIKVITRSTNYCKHVLVNATVIIFTGLLAFLPATVTNVTEVEMSYEFAQIGTVTFYYLNVVTNPLVYFCGHPQTRAAMKDWFSNLRNSIRDSYQNNVGGRLRTAKQGLAKKFRKVWYQLVVLFPTSKNSVSAEKDDIDK